MIWFALSLMILASTVLLSKQGVNAQTNCQDVITKLMTCEPFIFGYSYEPSPQCCSSAQDLVRAANASRDVLRATCRCLKTAVQSFPVDFSNAARITSLCHLNLSIPIDPSVNCDTLWSIWIWFFFFLCSLLFYFIFLVVNWIIYVLFTTNKMKYKWNES